MCAFSKAAAAAVLGPPRRLLMLLPPFFLALQQPRLRTSWQAPGRPSWLARGGAHFFCCTHAVPGERLIRGVKGACFALLMSRGHSFLRRSVLALPAFLSLFLLLLFCTACSFLASREHHSGPGRREHAVVQLRASAAGLFFLSLPIILSRKEEGCAHEDATSAVQPDI